MNTDCALRGGRIFIGNPKVNKNTFYDSTQWNGRKLYEMLKFFPLTAVRILPTITSVLDLGITIFSIRNIGFNWNIYSFHKTGNY